MKRILFVWLLLLLVIGNEILAQTADITQGCQPLTVQFTAPTGQTSFFWDFGDSATANQENPSNTYTGAGVYEVQFSNSPGGPVIGSITIDVYEQPTPTFTASPTEGCAPLNVSFNDETVVGAGINITGYSWVFGDGGSAVGASPNHVFNTAGSHYVSLEIQTNSPSCNVTEVYPDVITVAGVPLTNFQTTPFPAASCDVPFEVAFTNNSSSGGPLTYEWDFGNTSTSTDFEPTETYTENGTYTVMLTATDSLGCQGFFQQVVSVGPPTTEFIVPDTICIEDSIQIINQSSSGSYQWAFAAGNTPTSSTTVHPWVKFDQAGLQDITLTTTAGVCSSDLTVQVFVENPSAEFTSTPDYSCSQPMDVQFTVANSGYAEYEWLFGDSATSNLENPSHTYIYEDTTVYSWYGLDTLATRLIITSSAGCIDTVTHVDTLWLPNAVFFPDVVEGCFPLTVTFSDSSTSREDIVSWEWHLGDGTVVNASDNSPQSVTYTSVGHFNSYLIITNAAGCTDTSYNVTTIVGDALTPDFTVDVTQVCPGDPVQFTNQTALSDSVDYWHYYSETNRQFHCFDDPNPTWSYTNETGPMDVSLIVGFNGCYSTTTMNDLIQVDGPVAEIFFNCECDTPFEVAFEDKSHDATYIVWDFGDNTTSTDANPTHTYAATGDYTVVLTATNSITGCDTSYDSATIHIREIEAQFQSDSVICQGVGSPFDASLSQDVYSACWNGYTWQFDNPTIRPITTTDASYPIEFPSSGQYGVSLIVTDINGCTDTAHSNIGVYSIETQFSMSDNHICSPTEVNFTDQTTSDTTIASWEWDFGDMLTSGSQNPDHIYTGVSDTVFVQLVTTSVVGCVDTTETFITTYTPTSFVSSAFPNICVGESINFFASDYTQGGSNLTFDWDFLDGETSQIQNPSHTFDSAGTFLVNMVYTEVGSGCTDSADREVNVQDLPIAGFFRTDDSSSVFCLPKQATFADTTWSDASYNRQWDYGNNETPQTGSPVSTVYTNSGSYTVTLIVTTSNGCADTISHDYLGIDPQGNFVIDKDTICRGEEITFTITDTNEVYNYVFDFGDGNSAENQSPIPHTYTFVPPSGATVGKLVVTGPGGECAQEATIPIYIHDVKAGFTLNNLLDTIYNLSDTVIDFCFQAVYLDNKSSLLADVYSWDFGDTNTSSDEQPGTYEFPSAGTYDIVLGVKNNELGCTDTMKKTLVLHPIPELFAFGDTICEGDVGDLSVEDVETSSEYTWTSLDVAYDVDNPNVAITTSAPLLTADYEVFISDTNSCTNLDTTTIRVINPLVLSDWDTTIVIGDSICLPLEAEEGLYVFDWKPTDGLDCDTCGSPCLQPMELVTYSVEVTDVLGCFSSKADFTVDIYPETFISFPTTFTPNGDDANPIIYVEGWGIKELLEYKVFNRWGEELFFTSNVEEGWDGTYKGVLQNNDVYVYKIKALTWRDETKALEGYFNLIR